MRFNKIFNSFSAGEISPKLISRTDIDQYNNGSLTVNNFTINKTGGAFKRPGLELTEDLLLDHVTPGWIPSNNIVLIPFVLADTTGYLGIQLDDQPLAAPTNLFVICNNKTVRGYAMLDGALGTTTLDSTLDINEFRSQQIDGQVTITHTSGKMPPLIFTWDLDASGTVYFYLRNMFTMPTLTTIGYAVSLVEAMPITPFNTSSTTLKVDTAHAGVGLLGSWISTTISCNDSSFTDDDIDSIFYIDMTSSAIDSVFVATGRVSADQLSGILISDAASTTATTNWRRSAFSTKLGYPKSLGFYNSRQLLAGTAAFPARYWNSRVEEYTVLQNEYLAQDSAAKISGSSIYGTLGDADPFSLQLMSGNPLAISWIAVQNDLFIGTTAGDYRITFSASADSGYSRNNAYSTAVSSVNCHNSLATSGDEKLIYFADRGRRVRTIDVQSGDFTYKNTDVSILADHLVDYGSDVIPPNTEEAYYKSAVWVEDHSMLWAVTSNNYLISMTLNENSGVIAWAKHDLGNYGDGNSVELDNLAVHVEGNKQMLSLVATYKDASDVLLNKFLMKLDISVPVYLDAFTTFDLGAPAGSYIFPAAQGYYSSTSVDVVIYDNGYPEYLGKFPVDASGEIIFSKDIQKFTVGYAYTSTIRSLAIEAGQQYGSARGNTIRTDRATISLYKSQHGRAGGSDTGLNSLELPLTSFFSGDKVIEMSAGDDEREYRYTIESSVPLALNVLGVTVRGVTYDG